MIARSVLTVALFTVVSAAAAAQQSPLPARDVPRERNSSGGVISGVVTAADTGLPVRGVDIRLTGTGVPAGAGGGRGAFTDASGRYEFADLPDGTFTLVASKVRYMTMTYGQTRTGEEGKTIAVAGGQRVEKVNFALPAGAVIVLRVFNRFGEPAPNYDVRLYQATVTTGQRALTPVADANGLQRITDDRGEIRFSGLQPGEYYTSAQGAEPLTFFPGTPAEADAQPITVGLGEEIVVGFETVASRLSRISGQVAGRARAENLRMERRTANGMMLVDLLISVAPDGTFSRSNLSPGEYVFTARNDKELGKLTVQLGEEDISSLVLTMTPAQPIRGRVTFEGTPPSGVAQTAFLPRPILENGSLTVVGQWRPDGTFEIPAPGGSGVLRMSQLPRGWFLKSVLLDRRDITDTVLDFETYEGKPLEIVVTQAATEISGRVADGSGQAVTNYVAVAFAEDSQQWTPVTRHIASVRPDQQGRFSVRGLPPGRYRVAAVDYPPSGLERDPAILERLRGRSLPVTLSDGATQTVMVTLAP